MVAFPALGFTRECLGGDSWLPRAGFVFLEKRFLLKNQCAVNASNIFSSRLTPLIILLVGQAQRSNLAERKNHFRVREL